MLARSAGANDIGRLQGMYRGNLRPRQAFPQRQADQEFG
jgi:hypothetical protein